MNRAWNRRRAVPRMNMLMRRDGTWRRWRRVLGLSPRRPLTRRQAQSWMAAGKPPF